MLAPQALQQRQDIGLHRNIESGQNLVAEQELRLRHQRPRDRHALALAARKLIGIARGIAGIEAHILERARDALFDGRAVQIEENISSGRARMVPIRARGFNDASGFWKIYWMRRRSSRERARDEARQGLALEPDASFRRREEAAHRPRDGRFAAARLADQRKGLALLDREREILHHVEEQTIAENPRQRLLAP